MSPSASTSLPALNRALFQPGERLCAAVSGGADSVALLLLLHQQNSLSRNALGAVLSAVHVHHGLRGEEADRDAEFLRHLCESLAVPLRVECVSVPERMIRSREEGRPETLEEAARTARYTVFSQILSSGSADAVLTAHTLDDQAETVLHKLLRGAWTKGLSGIHPVISPPPGAPPSSPGRILRPILHLRRSELREFLVLRNQAWREDSSNADPAHTRNRIRHQLLPALRAENPAIDMSLAHIAVLAREDEQRWSTELARLLPQVLLPGTPVRGGGRASGQSSLAGGQTVAIEIERLRAMDPALRRRVLREAARSLGLSLSFDETAALLALAGLGAPEDVASATQPPRRIQLANGLTAERSPRELRLQRLS